MNQPEYITVNGTRYATANLSDAAKAQAANVRVADAEIARLQQQLAIAQTARNAYFNALMGAIKHKDTAPVVEKAKKPRAPRKPKVADAD